VEASYVSSGVIVESEQKVTLLCFSLLVMEAAVSCLCLWRF